MKIDTFTCLTMVLQTCQIVRSIKIDANTALDISAIMQTFLTLVYVDTVMHFSNLLGLNSIPALTIEASKGVVAIIVDSGTPSQFAFIHIHTLGASLIHFVSKFAKTFVAAVSVGTNLVFVAWIRMITFINVWKKDVVEKNYKSFFFGNKQAL